MLVIGCETRTIAFWKKQIKKGHDASDFKNEFYSKEQFEECVALVQCAEKILKEKS